MTRPQSGPPASRAVPGMLVAKPIEGGNANVALASEQAAERAAEIERREKRSELDCNGDRIPWRDFACPQCAAGKGEDCKAKRGFVCQARVSAAVAEVAARAKAQAVEAFTTALEPVGANMIGTWRKWIGGASIWRINNTDNANGLNVTYLDSRLPSSETVSRVRDASQRATPCEVFEAFRASLPSEQRDRVYIGTGGNHASPDTLAVRVDGINVFGASPEWFNRGVTSKPEKMGGFIDDMLVEIKAALAKQPPTNNGAAHAEPQATTSAAGTEQHVAEPQDAAPTTGGFSDLRSSHVAVAAASVEPAAQQPHADTAPAPQSVTVASFSDPRRSRASAGGIRDTSGDPKTLIEALSAARASVGAVDEEPLVGLPQACTDCTRALEPSSGGKLACVYCDLSAQLEAMTLDRDQWRNSARKSSARLDAVYSAMTSQPASGAQ